VSARAAGLVLPLAVALALGGLGVAAYLTVVHYAHQPIVCSSIGDCELVNSSRYAKVGGVPVALLGAASYAMLAVLATAAWLRRDAMVLLGAWALALAAFAFSMYLTYIELRVLHAICVYCVASAGLMTALFAVLSFAAWQARDELLPAGRQEPRRATCARAAAGRAESATANVAGGKR
jgi:uncharacterized membrane protein